MITLVRLEGESATLAGLIADLDAAEKCLKLPKQMRVHDEHYERTAPELFKGRRVFRPGEKDGSLPKGWGFVPLSGTTNATVVTPETITYTPTT